VADHFVALSAQADKCAVFGRPPVHRMRYLCACPAVTRFAIVFAGGQLSKNHGCCPDTAGVNASKSWADVFHGLPFGENEHDTEKSHRARQRETARKAVDDLSRFLQSRSKLIESFSTAKPNPEADFLDRDPKTKSLSLDPFPFQSLRPRTAREQRGSLNPYASPQGAPP
jgi:hypothetical protein